MRIAILNSLYFPDQVGGAEISVRNLAESLSQSGAQVLVISVHRGKNILREELGGVSIVRLPIPNIYWPFASDDIGPVSKCLWHAIDSYNLVSKSKVFDLLREFKPDIVQTHNITGFSPSIWSSIKALNVPLVHTLRDYSLLCPKTSMMSGDSICKGVCKGCRISRFPHHLLSSRVRAVVGVSEFILKTHLTAGLFSNATAKLVIHNSFERLAESKDAEPEPSSNSAIKLGFLGAVAKHKGVEVLLSAVSTLRPEAISVEIAGSGASSYVDTLRTSYPGRNISFVGKVDPAAFFQRIDLLVVPSVWNEPFGRVIIEAFAYGRAVIGSDAGGISELIDDGVDGRLVPPNNSDALQRILQEFIINPARLRSMGAAAKAKSRRFAGSLTVKKYLDLHRSLIA